jgi:hypothetical protein
MVKELAPEEFNERLLPIFRDVERKFSYPGGKFDPEYFFPTWQNLMKIKVARTWEQGSGDAVLGAIFAPNIFVKNENALVTFWYKRDAAPTGIPVFKHAIKEARKAGCKLLYSAVYHGLTPPRVKEALYRLGFEDSETVLRKRL